MENNPRTRGIFHENEVQIALKTEIVYYISLQTDDVECNIEIFNTYKYR